MSRKDNDFRAIVSIDAHIETRLTYEEAKALWALFCYDNKKFLEFFYQNMGRAYLEKWEKGFFSLARKVTNELPSSLQQVEMSLKAIDEESVVVNKALYNRAMEELAELRQKNQK